MSVPTIDTVEDHLDEVELLIPEVRRQTRRRRTFIVATWIVLVAIAATAAFAFWSIGAGGPARRSSATVPGNGLGLGRATSISLSRAPSAETYVYSGATFIHGSTVYFRGVEPVTPPRPLVPGIWVTETPAAGPWHDVEVVGGGAYRGVSVYAVGTRTASLRFRTSAVNDNTGDVLLATRDDTYMGVGASVSEVDSRTGRVVHTYGAYSIPFNPPPYYRGMAFGPTNPGVIGSLILDQGRLFALQFDGYGAAVDDLSNGTRHILSGYGELAGGAIATNGDLYFMAWSFAHHSNLHLLQVDPSNLSVVATIDTGVRAEFFTSMDMQALPGGGLLAFLTQQRQSQTNIPVDAYLWDLSSSGLQRVDLPSNIGLHMRAFKSGIYIFGGPGRNEVSRLSLSTLTLVRNLPSLATPVGTYIETLT